MSKGASKIVRRFGYVNSLIVGTGIASNLVSFGLISLVPGFGSQGVFISAGIMLFFSGLIEIPTGVFADKFGWSFSVRLGLAAKGVATIFMFTAVCFAVAGASYFVWLFIALEALVDGVAAAFLSGSLQAHYNRLYLDALPEEIDDGGSVPSLFLVSYPQGLWLRFFLPFLTGGLGFIVIGALDSDAISNRLWVALPLVFVFFLRFIVYFVTNRDLKRTKIVERERLKTSKFSELIAFFMLSPKAIVSYSLFVFVRLSITMVVLAEAYKVFQSLNLSFSSSWFGGFLAAFTVMSLSMVCSAYIFPAIAARLKIDNIYRLSFLGCFFSSAVLSWSLLCPGGLLSDLVAIYFFCFSGLFFSDLGRNQILAQVPKLAPGGQDATWVSVGEFLALISFSFTLLLCTFINPMVNGLLFVSLLLFVLLLVLGVGFKFSFVESSRKREIPFKNVLFICVSVSTLAFVVIAGSLFFVWQTNAAYTEVGSLRQYDIESSADGVREALLQGAFTEAISRSNKNLGRNGLICAELVYNRERLTECGSDKTVVLSKELRMPASGTVVGKVLYHYSNSEIQAKIVSLTLKGFCLIALLGVIFYVSLFFLVNVFHREWETSMTTLSSSLVCPEKGGSFIAEVNAVLSSFTSAKSSAAELVAAQAVIDNAAQVAHDIRSPLCALEVVAATSPGFSEKNKKIFSLALARMRLICDELSFKKMSLNSRQRFNVAPSNDVPVTLGVFFENLVVEKQAKIKVRENIKLKSNINIYPRHQFRGVRQSSIFRVLSNLIDNSFEAIEGAGTVDLVVESEKGSSWLKIAISDDGIGVAYENIEKVGLKGYSNGKTGGSGLGVFNAKSVVESAGGVLVFNSWESKGSKVLIRLPIEESKGG